MDDRETNDKRNSRACCRGRRARYCPSVERFLTDPPATELPVGDEDRRSGTKHSRTIAGDEIKLGSSGDSFFLWAIADTDCRITD